MAIGFQGEMETAIFIENNLYKLLIIKLIYLNVGGVSDHDARRRTAAATIGARLVGVRMPSYALSGAKGRTVLLFYLLDTGRQNKHSCR